jgi:hypothetical protein
MIETFESWLNAKIRVTNDKLTRNESYEDVFIANVELGVYRHSLNMFKKVLKITALNEPTIEVITNKEIEQQAIKTLTDAGWIEVVYEEMKKGKDYVFEKNNRFVVVDKGHFSQIGSQPISANELDALATLCRATERKV